MYWIVQNHRNQFLYAIVSQNGPIRAIWSDDRSHAMRMNQFVAISYALSYGGYAVPFVRRQKKVEKL